MDFGGFMQNMNIMLALLGGFGLLVLLLVVFIYKKKQRAAEVVNTNEPKSSATAVNAGKKDNKQKLTMQEMVELSWKFLYEITELIANKFSKEDKELVNTLGHVLLDKGVKYEHVVDLAVQTKVASKAQNVEQQSYGQSQQTLGK